MFCVVVYLHYVRLIHWLVANLWSFSFSVLSGVFVSLMIVFVLGLTHLLSFLYYNDSVKRQERP